MDDEPLRTLRLDWPAAADWLDRVDAVLGPLPGARDQALSAHAQAVEAGWNDQARLVAFAGALMEGVGLARPQATEAAAELAPGSLRRVLGMENTAAARAVVQQLRRK